MALSSKKVYMVPTTATATTYVNVTGPGRLTWLLIYEGVTGTINVRVTIDGGTPYTFSLGSGGAPFTGYCSLHPSGGAISPYVNTGCYVPEKIDLTFKTSLKLEAWLGTANASNSSLLACAVYET